MRAVVLMVNGETQRNGVNLCSDKTVGRVVLSSQSNDEVLALVQKLPKDLSPAQPSPKEGIPAGGETNGNISPPHRAILTVGSPKTRNSDLPLSVASALD